MALIILGFSKCSICEETLKKGDTFINLQHLFHAPHRFSRQSDTGMHQTCFLNWQLRDEFRSDHDAFWIENSRNSWTWRMLEDGSVIRVD